ncbi:DUF1212-domain-containing protein [Testicularia cyperi]|uniref:DUF1212-domain-containing protein n=1 Tax=Testicularia cyperi TaxID=1882483 RepID=A0A317XS69_9BASI|nr:DUF1212-domain-containing protein [Testicularia cyperi]
MSDAHENHERGMTASSTSTADSSTLPTGSNDEHRTNASDSSQPQSNRQDTNQADHNNPFAHRFDEHSAASARQAGDTSASPSLTATRRTGRVHWDGSSNAASVRRGGGLLLNAGGALAGPTVTARGGARPEGGLSLGSVRRHHHPGPLNLAERLTPSQEAGPSSPPQAAAATAPEKQPATQIPTLTLTGAKGLDEQGLDNRAFLELQRELQRHEAREVDASRQRNDPAARERLIQAFMERERDRDERRRRRAAQFRSGTETPADLSGATTPGSATSDSSYDPANDSDLDHIDFIPGETDGMPSRIKKPKHDVAEEAQQPKGWAKLRGIFGKPAEEEEDPEEKAEAPKAHDQGGPTNWKSVPVETSSGLHTGDGPRRRPTKFERQAARLVQQHKLAQQRQDALSRIGRGHPAESGSSTPDAADIGSGLDARPVASGGVLGNLLLLYEQQQRELNAKSAGASSVGSVSEFTMDRDTGAPSDVVSNPTPPAVQATMASSDFGRRVDRYEKRRAFSMQSIPLPSPGFTHTFAKVGNAAVSTSSKVVRGVATEAGFDQALDERPKAARSGAGVFGALVATTGNLVGACSPQHAQLGPNPKRPGFSLDRYLLPEMNAKTLKRTAQIVADAAPAPFRPSNVGSPLASRSHSLPTSPGADGNGDSTQANSPTASGQHTPLKNKRPASIVHFPSRTITGGSSNDGTGPRKRHFPLPGAMSRAWTHSNLNTPDVNAGLGPDYFGPEAEKLHDDLSKQEWQRKLKKRAKDKRKKEEIFITMHVAAILQRQEFVLKLARALMMFGAPTHRIETQIQQTARVLEINCRCIYLPNLMLVAFGDETTHTSETRFIKQSSGLDLTKLTDMHTIYWNVIHDKIGVEEASSQLDELMRRKPLIGRWPMVLVGGFASAFICVGPQGFSGSFIDALMAFPLGAFLVYCQSIITTELYSNVFEIVFATFNSFIAAAVQSSGYFCYSAVVSGSIVLILPGFIVLSGSLELQAKNLIAGSVRLVYAIIYSLFLGFGISIGVSFWQLFSSQSSTQGFNSCTVQHTDQWWRSDVGEKWAILTTPAYSMSLSLRNQAKVTRKEFPVMVIIACAGWACNHFAAKASALSGRQDVTSALGSLAVGILANIYGRFFDGRSFVVSVPGILYQLPSGLSNGGGLLNFANNSDSTSAFASGFTVAQSLVEVALGLTVGLFASTVLSYLLGGRRIRNGGGLFSF